MRRHYRDGGPAVDFYDSFTPPDSDFRGDAAFYLEERSGGTSPATAG